jgi:aryl-alcohol dehydrogenase-like predicted oxidoreductase
MQYRKLGNTGLDVSCIGLGCAQIGYLDPEPAVHLVRHALDLGVNYFDVARGYLDAEIKVGRATAGQRDRAILSTKTGARTRDDAWREIHESLERLGTDHVDNCHLHGLHVGEDIEQRLGSGGALEALIEAKERGLVRHIGCTSHKSAALLEALERYPFEVILVPMNIAERDPLGKLIPLCERRGVGVTIMKPVATGLVPARLSLKWLLNQPIACAVPGASTLDELEEDAGVGMLLDPTLTPGEAAEADAIRDQLAHVRCRVCEDCEPCPQGILVSIVLGTDVMYDHYRNMGPERFRAVPWNDVHLQRDLESRVKGIEAIRSCDRCRTCEAKCRYGLPIVDMLEDRIPALEDMVATCGELLAP